MNHRRLFGQRRGRRDRLGLVTPERLPLLAEPGKVDEQSEHGPNGEKDDRRSPDRRRVRSRTNGLAIDEADRQLLEPPVRPVNHVAHQQAAVCRTMPSSARPIVVPTSGTDFGKMIRRTSRPLML